MYQYGRYPYKLAPVFCKYLWFEEILFYQQSCTYLEQFTE